MKQISSDTGEKPQPVMSKEQVLAAQDVVSRGIRFGHRPATDLIRATRIRQESSPEFQKQSLGEQV